MQRPQPPHRMKSERSASNTKRAVVGNTAGTVAPAWRSQPRPLHRQQQVATPNGPGNGAERRRDLRKGSVGSKILMSQLPPETVHETDIEELFKETIGPVFEVFLIYNSQGRSKGMAVVNFQRNGDAAEARRRYNGKIIDGRRPLKIELITDLPEAPLLSSPKEKTLAERLEGPLSSRPEAKHRVISPSSNRLILTGHHKPQPQQRQRRNLKKGPRRLKKSVEQLDREMEAYRAAAPRFSEFDISAAVGGDAMQV